MKTQNPPPNPEAENANGEAQPPQHVLEIVRLYKSLSKDDRKILSAQLSNILYLDGAIMAAVSILMMEHEYIQLMEPEEQQRVRPVLNRLYKRVSDAYVKILRPREEEFHRIGEMASWRYRPGGPSAGSTGEPER